MIVDDNIDAAQSLGFLLESEGHQVRLAHDGARALVVAEECAPELIFLDIGLPEIDGYEVAKRLRCNEKHRDVTLVTMTGYGQASDLRLAREAGFDHHLIKPADLDQIAHIVAYVGTNRRRSIEGLVD